MDNGGLSNFLWECISIFADHNGCNLKEIQKTSNCYHINPINIHDIWRIIVYYRQIDGHNEDGILCVNPGSNISYLCALHDVRVFIEHPHASSKSADIWSRNFKEYVSLIIGPHKDYVSVSCVGINFFFICPRPEALHFFWTCPRECSQGCTCMYQNVQSDW